MEFWEVEGAFIHEAEKKKNSDLNDLNKGLQQKYDKVNSEMQIMSQLQEKVELKESCVDISTNNLGENHGNINYADELKKKIDELENENMDLRKQIELNETDKSTVSKAEFERVQKENYILKTELTIEKEKNNKASEKN